MDWGFTWLLTFINEFWNALVSVVKWLVDGGIYAIQKALYIPYDAILTAIEAMVGSVSLGSLTGSMASAWGLLPPQVVWWVNAVNLPAGLGLIATAIVVRLTLNLIPGVFTRV